MHKARSLSEHIAHDTLKPRMTRLIGIDLSSTPPQGAIVEYDASSTGGIRSARCISTFPLVSENLTPELREQFIAADASTAAIAPEDGFGLNITLPFADKRRVSALLPQELEDILPFPSTEFAIGFIGSGSTGSTVDRGNAAISNHFQIQLAPKNYVRSALTELASLGLDPNVLTPRSSVLVPIALAILNLDILKSDPTDDSKSRVNSFFIVSPLNAREADILFIADNRIVNYKTIKAATLSTHSENKDETNVVGIPSRSMAAAIILEIGSVSRRFNVSIDRGFVLLPTTASATEIGDIVTLHNNSGIEISMLALDELFPSLQITDNNARAALAALCSSDLHSGDSRFSDGSTRSRLQAGSEPINFRRGEFSYRPALGELVRVGRRLVRPLFLTLGCAALCAACVYLFRAQEISRLQHRLARSVASVAPQISTEPGNELTALSDEAAKMELELKDIGTSDDSSPLELYAELTRHFPQLPDTTVDRVSIRGNRIEIRGCAPSYRVIEQIENALTKVKRFGKVKKGNSQGCSGGGTGSRGFTFEVNSRD